METKVTYIYIYRKVTQNNAYPLTRKAFSIVPSVLFLKAALPTTHSIDFETCNLYMIFSLNSKMRLTVSTDDIISVFRFLMLLIRGL